MLRIALVLSALSLAPIIFYAAFQLLFLTTVEVHYGDALCSFLLLIPSTAALAVTIQALRKRPPSRRLFACTLLGGAAFGAAILVRNWGHRADNACAAVSIVGAVALWLWVDRKLRRATLLPNKSGAAGGT